MFNKNTSATFNVKATIDPVHQGLGFNHVQMCRSRVYLTPCCSRGDEFELGRGEKDVIASILLRKTPCSPQRLESEDDEYQHSDVLK